MSSGPVLLGPVPSSWHYPRRPCGALGQFGTLPSSPPTIFYTVLSNANTHPQHPHVIAQLEQKVSYENLNYYHVDLKQYVCPGSLNCGISVHPVKVIFPLVADRVIVKFNSRSLATKSY